MANEIFQAPAQNVEPQLTVEGYSSPPDTPDLGLAEAPPASPPEESLFSPKTVIFFLLIVIIIGAVVWAVYNFLKKGQPMGNGPVALSYWGLWEPKEVMESVIEDYRKKNPRVNISYETQSITEYRERLQAAIARGEGPDIFRFHSTWLPMLRNDLAAVPADVIKNDDYKKTFYPVSQSDLLRENKFYGVPLEIDGLVLLYNKDLLRSAGYSNPPKTWDEFEKMAGKITVKDGFGRVQTAGAAMGLAGNVEHFSDILGLIFYQNGVDFKDLVSERAIQAFTYYTLFAQKPHHIWDEYQNNSIIAFSSGKVGFIFAPSWQILNIKAISPNLNFGAAPVPQLAGATPAAWATYWVEGVSVKSNSQKEAFQFLQYLSSKEAQTKLFSEAVKTGRLFGEPYSRVDLGSTLIDNEYLSPLLQQAPIMRSWYLASRTFDNGLNDRIIKYLENGVTSVVRGSSPQGALEVAAQGVNQVLGEYGVK